MVAQKREISAVSVEVMIRRALDPIVHLVKSRTAKVYVAAKPFWIFVEFVAAMTAVVQGAQNLMLAIFVKAVLYPMIQSVSLQNWASIALASAQTKIVMAFVMVAKSKIVVGFVRVMGAHAIQKHRSVPSRRNGIAVGYVVGS